MGYLSVSPTLRPTLRPTKSRKKIKQNHFSQNVAIEFPNSYEGCITSFCDPKLFQKKFAFNVLDADNVWACFGCHPHHAHLYNAEVEAQLELLAKHPKVLFLFGKKKLL